jgi:hypothetical protein
VGILTPAGRELLVKDLPVVMLLLLPHSMPQVVAVGLVALVKMVFPQILQLEEAAGPGPYHQ